jgi:hypothetical protein
VNDLKLALRQLRLRPGLSFVVVVMLALGIGATTAMFSLYHQILLRPLPVPEPHRLVNLAAPGPGKVGGNYRDLAIGNFEAQFSYPMFRDLEARGGHRLHGPCRPHRFHRERQLCRADEL